MSEDYSESEYQRADVDYSCVHSVCPAGVFMSIQNAMQEHKSHEDAAKYIAKAQQAGKYLSQMIHSNECRGKCGRKECLALHRLINHCVPCRNGTGCVISGCSTTKTLINHRKHCYAEEQAAKALGVEKRECLICTIASKHMRSTNAVSIPITAEKNNFSNISGSPTSVMANNSPLQSIPEWRKGGATSGSESLSLSDSHISDDNSSRFDNSRYYSDDVVDSPKRDRYQSEEINRPSRRLSSGDGEFAIPTMLPKRFRDRCVSTTEIDMNRYHGHVIDRRRSAESYDNVVAQSFDSSKYFNRNSFSNAQSPATFLPRDRLDSI